jgi:hypothetical protein
MALLKSVPTDFGAAASYWRVAALQEDLVGKTLDVTLQGFFDQAARRGGKQPMAIWRGRLEGERYPQTPSLADIYTTLKKLADWAAAQDDPQSSTGG